MARPPHCQSRFAGEVYRHCAPMYGRLLSGKGFAFVRSGVRAACVVADGYACFAEATQLRLGIRPIWIAPDCRTVEQARLSLALRRELLGAHRARATHSNR